MELRGAFEAEKFKKKVETILRDTLYMFPIHFHTIICVITICWIQTQDVTRNKNEINGI